ncbi:hypothetical protein PPACK8108_LOCUS17804 [Phakopsora pachyrhizi]|uniref:Uncharacterized protein n=1 Tax=Phakopsora pachyrhizi TaxID=170000 RepID=A0AAV0B9Y9_PHAPC|nr:hypothetical protein PPACK8108_LOCUS17804 [Phakopsora pachyrhizi]
MKVKSDNTPIKPDTINKTQTKVMIEIGLEVKMWKSKLEALRLSPLESKFRISKVITLEEEEEFGSDAVDCESDGKEEERDYHVNKMHEEERDDGGYTVLSH